MPVFQMSADGQIALKLHKAGCKPEIIDYCFQVLADSGYRSPAMFANIDVAIERMKRKEMPQAFEEDNAPPLTDFQRFKRQQAAL